MLAHETYKTNENKKTISSFAFFFFVSFVCFAGKIFFNLYFRQCLFYPTAFRSRFFVSAESSVHLTPRIAASSE